MVWNVRIIAEMLNWKEKEGKTKKHASLNDLSDGQTEHTVP